MLRPMASSGGRFPVFIDSFVSKRPRSRMLCTAMRTIPQRGPLLFAAKRRKVIVMRASPQIV